MSSVNMEQGMRQSMIASAQMQMYMRALAANSTELEQMVTEAIASNPVLEEDRSRELLPSSKGSEQVLATERHERFLNSLTAEESLSDHLRQQIQQSGLPQTVEQVALYLVDNLNDKGYFEDSPHHLTQELGTTGDVVQAAIHAIQDLEPAGVGARDLQESLLLQLERLNEGKGIAFELIKEHWDCLIAHRFGEAAKRMDLEEEAIIGAARRISQLNPDPGSGFSKTEQLVITADVIVERDEAQQLLVRLNQDKAPQLSLSADYRSMMAEKADNAELRRYLSKCFREGRELIHAIEQRQQSVLEVSRAIVVRQQAFFDAGPHAIEPMKMEQIAQDTDMHVSTISRAVRNKYLRCEHGLFELRSFFTAGLSQSDGEGDIAAGAVQSRIRKLIEAEDKKKPLSDAKLEKALAAEGIQIARRTIAKYREQMKILPASLRKLV
ncbi:MAG: RNA polymerase factor sigma-54 [Akkermansia sp.]